MESTKLYYFRPRGDKYDVIWGTEVIDTGNDYDEGWEMMMAHAAEQREIRERRKLRLLLEARNVFLTPRILP